MSDFHIGAVIVTAYIALLIWIVWRVETMLKGRLGEEMSAHDRCADALTTKNERIERALACVTENSAHVGKKMARILRGDA